MKYRCLRHCRMLRGTALRWTGNGLLSIYQRAASTVVTEFRNLHQGGRLVIDASAFESAKLQIASAWQDHCTLHHIEGMPDNLIILEEEEDNSLLIEGSKSGEAMKLSLLVPEYFDVHVRGKHVDLELQKKIQGDVSIAIDSGSIKADKVRGESLIFHVGSASIQVAKALEGAISVKCGSFVSKMIHSDSFHCKASGIVSVEALYGAKSHIEADDNVTVGASSGMVQANTTGGSISINGIDGSFQLTAPRGSIDMQINKLGAVPSRAEAAKQIIAAIDPEIAASINCISSSHASTRALVSIVSDAFELTNDEHDVTLPRVGMYEGGTIAGYLTGRSTGLKRPQFVSGTSQSGKIDLNGAEASWQGTSSKIDDAFDIEFVADGNIRVETLSWIEIIRRKHGFGHFDDNTSTQRKSVAGRTASAKLRAAELIAESQKRSES